VKLTAYRDHQGMWREIWVLNPAQLAILGIDELRNPDGWSRTYAAALEVTVLGMAPEGVVCDADARAWHGLRDHIEAAGRRCRDLDCREEHECRT
jgi:hypothetical protein